MKLFDFAMRMEQDGRKFYEKLAAEASVEGLKKIFTQLAADEQKHYGIFLALKAETKPEMDDTSVLEQTKTVFEDLLAQKETVGPVKGDLTAYEYAMKLEVESFRLYEEAAAKEAKEPVKALLLRIAAEEHKHREILQNIYDFINAPNQYLAWEEFSNLGDGFHQFGRNND